MTTGYTSFVLSEESRELLLMTFDTKYPDIIAYHITHQFGIDEGVLPSQPKNVSIIGLHSGDNIQVLSVEVDGNNKQTTQENANKRFFHITFSLDRSKGVQPKNSNDLL